MAVSLANIRDLLLPGVWVLNGKGSPKVDISIDFSHDCIMISVSGAGREVLFTRQEIKDRAYLANFASRVEAFKAKTRVRYEPYGATEGAVSGSAEPEQ